MPTLPATMPPTPAPEGHARRPASREASRSWPVLAGLTKAALIDLYSYLLAEHLGRPGEPLSAAQVREQARPVLESCGHRVPKSWEG